MATDRPLPKAVLGGIYQKAARETTTQRQAPPSVIRTFVDNWTTKGEYHKYEALAQAAKALFEHKFNKKPPPEVKCIVLARGKSSETIEKSINRREAARRHEKQPDGKVLDLGQFAELEDIREAMPDLAGICIILVFPDDEKVVKFIKESTTVKSWLYWGVKEDGSLRVEQFAQEKKRKDRFPGYRALHYRVSLKKELDDEQPEYLKEYWTKQWNTEWEKMDVEVQITSMTMYAWKEVHHDLVYKTYQGELTTAEITTLDMVNGIVLVNEIAINTFHQALEKRLEEIRRPFRNVDHLKHWLIVYMGEDFHPSFKSKPPPMEFAEPLLQTLRLFELGTPEKLVAELKKVTRRTRAAGEPPVTLRRQLLRDEDYNPNYGAAADRAINDEAAAARAAGNREFKENKADEAAPLGAVFNLIREWREAMDLLFTARPSKVDASAWALFCICETKSPFKTATTTEALRQFIILAAFAMEMVLKSTQDYPRASGSHNWHLEAVRPDSALANMLCWSGQTLEAKRERETLKYTGERGTWSALQHAIRLQLSSYNGFNDWPKLVSSNTYVPVSVSMALLGVCPIPYSPVFEWTWNADSSVLWPGLVNVRALAAYHGISEADATSKMRWLEGFGETSASWDNFLVIVDDRWEQYQYSILGRREEDSAWKYVKTGVPALLGQELDINRWFTFDQLKATGKAERERYLEEIRAVMSMLDPPVAPI